MPPDDREKIHRKDAKSAKGELVKKWGGVFAEIDTNEN